jgi:hypothetical protein
MACGSASLSAQAVTEARAITLRASDVSGFAAGNVPTFRPFGTGPLGARVERCDGGMPGPSGIVGVRGQFLHSDVRPESIHSAVYVLASEAAALRELAAVSSARARTCIEHQMSAARAEFDGNALTRPLFTGIGVGALPTELGPHFFGLRISGATFGSRGPSRYCSDAQGFAIGRTLVVLYAQGYTGPVPTATELDALGLLYNRATGKRLLAIE